MPPPPSRTTSDAAAVVSLAIAELPTPCPIPRLTSLPTDPVFFKNESNFPFWTTNNFYAEMARREEEVRLNDPEEQRRLQAEEEQERLRAEEEMRHFEEMERKILEAWERKKVLQEKEEDEEDERRRRAEQEELLSKQNQCWKHWKKLQG